MPKLAGEPLIKVTLNLYKADVEWFQYRHGQGYSEHIRVAVHQHVSQFKNYVNYLETDDGQRD